jgi:hypothetical protein
MNPTEHLWDVVERSIHTQNPAPAKTRELWVAIQTAWLNISALRRARGCPILGTYPMTFGTSVYYYIQMSSPYQLSYHSWEKLHWQIKTLWSFTLLFIVTHQAIQYSNQT